MRDVILQHLFLDASKRGAHGRDLRHDIDAVAVLIHHLRQAADLALDAAEAFLTGCLDVFSHAAYIPLQGMGCKGQPMSHHNEKPEGKTSPDQATAKSCCGG